MSFYEWRGKDLIIRLKIQPRASVDGFAEIMNDRIKLRLTAPPVDGKANRHLTRYLSKVFKVPKGQVIILSGETGRDKRVRIVEPRVLPGIIQP
jgi:uncharacterized protein (TIGR00251 family)